MRLIPAINKILSSYQSIKYNKTAVNIILTELNKTNKPTNGIKKKINTFKKLSFLDVGFNYPKNDRYIFKSLNFKIESREKIGVQGSSGVGKTTFVNLISGLLQPTKGIIAVNNLSLNNSKNLTAWRNSIGYVPQKVFLLDDTIKNNILFGRNEKFYKIDDIFDILNKVGMYDYVKSLSKGNDTVVGENGQKISGGQAQRIGIARALLHNPSLLILDESTSSLDLNTEKIILNNIFLNLKNLTIISISHKSNALKFCNTIYEVKKNKLIKVK
jgi:ABC-type multidrug transport system fused ATPase/permease subunit